jgi:hypothetical protein
MRSTFNRMRSGRRNAVAVALLAMLVLWLGGAGPAAAAGPGRYNAAQVARDSGFTLLVSGNLLPADVQLDNSGTLVYLSTTGTGLHRLPFPLFLYNQKYSNIAISSNGNIQPGVQSPNGFSSPNGPFSCNFPVENGTPLVLAFWGPLYYDTSATGHGVEGVFVRTSGTAPHRTFTVSWQGQDLDADGGPILVQAVFTEGVQTVVFRYGSTVASRDFLTIGLQSKQKLTWTSYAACSDTNAAPGTRLTFTHTG